MPNVTQEDLNTDIADIRVDVPEKSQARKEKVHVEIKFWGLLEATYKNVPNYKLLYDILVRKYRGFNKFARINVNKKTSASSTYLFENAIKSEHNDSALLLLKLGADPNKCYHDTPLEMLLRRENDTRLLYFMIKAGANTQGCEGKILTSAVEANDTKFLHYLITEKKMDIICLKTTGSVFRYAQPKMLKFLIENGAEFDLTDGAILKRTLEYSSNKENDYARFSFWLDKGARFGDKGLEILKKAIGKNNHKIIEKVLDAQKFSNEDLTGAFFKQKYPSALSVLKKHTDVTQDQNDTWFLDIINHHVTLGQAPMLQYLFKKETGFISHINMAEVLVSSYKKVNSSNPENVRNVLWECGAYDAKTLMNVAFENNMWKLMQDVWKKYPDVDFSDTDQKTLNIAVQEGHVGLIDKVLERDVKVTPEMLQNVMEQQIKSVIHRLVCQEPYAEKSDEFKKAYQDKDQRAFNKLIAQYVDHDDFDWEALGDNTIVHHQGEDSDRTRLKIIFNFAVDTVTTVVYDQENKELAPTSTSLGFMEISNDDEIQRAHEKLKKFGKTPPENFETGAMGLGRRKTVLKLSK